ncbi:signal peptidase II [archaeon]|nr:signal peptidase II [archaeon]
MKRFLIIGFLIVLLDQITKVLFKDVHQGIINYVTNTGAAFSLFQNGGIYLVLISIIAVFFIFYFYFKYPKLVIPLAFLLGGTIGNLIDRISFGYVRDFIDLKVWPIFNIADSFNVIGVLIIGYLILKEKV